MFIASMARLATSILCTCHWVAEAPTDVMVPILDTSTGVGKEIEVPIPVIDVHELLDYVHSVLKLQCPVWKTQQFWDHLRQHGSRFALNYPGTGHVPFSIYGDEACLGNDPNDKVTGIFLSLTLHKPKNIRDGQFLICALPDPVLIHQNLKSLMPVLRHIVWSANVALSGRYPSCNADGKPLAPSKQLLAGKAFGDNRTYACVELKGDWKFHERVLRLLSTPTSLRCCFLCNAHARDGPLRYHDLAPSAGWLGTEYNTVDVLTRGVLRPGPLRPLPAQSIMSIPGVISSCNARN